MGACEFGVLMLLLLLLLPSLALLLLPPPPVLLAVLAVLVVLVVPLVVLPPLSTLCFAAGTCIADTSAAHFASGSVWWLGSKPAKRKKQVSNAWI
jgi:hypothetical protein